MYYLKNETKDKLKNFASKAAIYFGANLVPEKRNVHRFWCKFGERKEQSQ